MFIGESSIFIFPNEGKEAFLLNVFQIYLLGGGRGLVAKAEDSQPRGRGFKPLGQILDEWIDCFTLATLTTVNGSMR